MVLHLHSIEAATIDTVKGTFVPLNMRLTWSCALTQCMYTMYTLRLRSFNSSKLSTIRACQSTINQKHRIIRGKMGLFIKYQKISCFARVRNRSAAYVRWIPRCQISRFIVRFHRYLLRMFNDNGSK